MAFDQTLCPTERDALYEGQIACKEGIPREGNPYGPTATSFDLEHMWYVGWDQMDSMIDALGDGLERACILGWFREALEQARES